MNDHKALNATSLEPYPETRDLLMRLVYAWLLTGLIDGTFSSVLSVFFYQSTVSRLFQGVASVLLGSDALNGGTRTAAIGIVMHFGVALTWSAIFLLLVLRLKFVRKILASRFGVVAIAAVYGPMVWMVMSLIVIPSLVHRPPNITIRWWVQLIGHFPFVGLPIVACSAGRSRQTAGVSNDSVSEDSVSEARA